MSASATRVLVPATALLLVGCPPPPERPTEPVTVPVSTAKTAAPTPAATAGDCPAGMIWFAATTSPMGAPATDDDALPEDLPQHPVTVASFCMAMRETTVAEYSACYRAGNCTAARPTSSPECNMGVSGKEDHPINCVNFDQAATYCEAMGGRLPSEEEWERAARGATTRKYPWGSTAPTTADMNACDEECMKLALKIDMMFETSDGFAMTAPVGSFPKGNTPEGLADMAGNVAEWTSGRDCPYGEKTCTAEKRIVRGGGWNTGFRESFTTWGRFAGARDPGEISSGVGFRCAMTPPPMKP